MLIPAAMVEQANKLAEGLGHGPNNFYIPLSADGQAPPSHYGCFTAAQQDFIDLLSATGQGILPEIEGMTPQEVGATLMNLDVDVAYQPTPIEHIRSVLETRGLQQILEVEVEE
jgi:hypothetical protein